MPRKRPSEVYGSKWLSAADIGKGGRYKITDSEEKLFKDDETGESEEKTIVWLRGETKGWILNKTNIDRLVGILGDDYDLWDGCFVSLVPEPYSFKGKSGVCIRVDVAATQGLNGSAIVTTSGGGPVLVGSGADSARAEVSRRPAPALTQQEADTEMAAVEVEDSGY